MTGCFAIAFLLAFFQLHDDDAGFHVPEQEVNGQGERERVVELDGQKGPEDAGDQEGAEEKRVPHLPVGGDADALGLVEEEAGPVDEEEAESEGADEVVGEKAPARRALSCRSPNRSSPRRRGIRATDS